MRSTGKMDSGMECHFSTHLKKMMSKSMLLIRLINFEQQIVGKLSKQILPPIVTHFIIYAKKLLPKYTKNAHEDITVLKEEVNKNWNAPESYSTSKQPLKYMLTKRLRKNQNYFSKCDE